MIAQSSHPRYRRIVETIGGKQWLSNPRLKRRALIIEDEDVKRCIECESVFTGEDTKSFYSGDFSTRSAKCSPVIKKISPRIKLQMMFAKRAREKAIEAEQQEEPSKNEDKSLMERVTFKFE
jgi:hypothetical protein